MIRCVKFFSPEFVLYLYESTIWPCLEYRCHAWAGASSSYLDMLDKLQNGECRNVGMVFYYLLPLLNPQLIVEMYPD